MKDGFLDDVFQKQNKLQDRIVPALVKTGVAATGGLIAGRVDAIATESWPKSAVAGPFLIALVSVSLRIFADGGSALEKIGQELAAGMAGWIGQDLWYLIRNFFGWGFKKWEPQVTYSAGAQVKFAGKLYRANADVKGGLNTPDKDPTSWRLIEGAAQGFRTQELSDLREFAQALANDKERWQAASIDVLNRVGPHIEEASGYTFSDDQKRRLIGSMTEVLQQSVRE